MHAGINVKGHTPVTPVLYLPVKTQNGLSKKKRPVLRTLFDWQLLRHSVTLWPAQVELITLIRTLFHCSVGQCALEWVQPSGRRPSLMILVSPVFDTKVSEWEGKTWGLCTPKSKSIKPTLIILSSYVLVEAPWPVKLEINKQYNIDFVGVNMGCLEVSVVVALWPFFHWIVIVVISILRCYELLRAPYQDYNKRLIWNVFPTWLLSETLCAIWCECGITDNL